MNHNTRPVESVTVTGWPGDGQPLKTPNQPNPPNFPGDQVPLNVPRNPPAA